MSCPSSTPRVRFLLLCGALLGLSSAALLPAQNKLWVVSDLPCPDVDFPDIQSAVDAAAGGDVILVLGRKDGGV